MPAGLNLPGSDGGSELGKDQGYAGTGKYALELIELGRGWAWRCARAPAVAWRGFSVARQLGVRGAAALRAPAEIDAGQRSGTTSSDATRMAELERENRSAAPGECAPQLPILRTQLPQLGVMSRFTAGDFWRWSSGLLCDVTCPSGRETSG